MNYTIQDMTMSRMVHKGGFALLDENNKPVIQIYNFNKRQFIDGSFVLDTATMTAMEEEKFESRKDKDGKVDIDINEGIRVEADLDQGIWFAAP